MLIFLYIVEFTQLVCAYIHEVLHCIERERERDSISSTERVVGGRNMTGHLCARESRMTCPPPVPGVRAERGSQWSGASVFRDEAGMPAAAASHLGALFFFFLNYHI